MLIKPRIEKDSIVSFRLITGETLIAKFVDLTLEQLVVTRPVVANPIQSEQGYGIYYTPFCATVDEDQEFVIPRSNLLLQPMHPRDELKQAYLKITTGLDIPSMGSSII